MAKMKWTKPSAETIAYFERIAPGPPIQARRMFGMPARFLNGHMLVAVFGNTFMLHLSESDRADCIRAGAKPFAPMGREAREYVDVRPGLFDDRTLKEWIVRGMRYLGSLVPKVGAKRGRVGAEGDDGDGAKRGRAAATDGDGAKRTVVMAKRAVAKRAGASATETKRAAKGRGGAKTKTRVTNGARTKPGKAKAKRTAGRATAKKAKTGAKKSKTRR